ncbi:MAG: xanthine dehydrogenase family protein molybdopterin-binding subunit [Burkholderiaceae bacterium]
MIAESTTSPGFVGKPIARTEDARFLTGSGRYVDDIAFDGMLHLYVVRSPVAHASISRIDLEAVRAMPGVVDAFSFSDVADRCRCEIPVPESARLPGYERFLQWPLAKGTVRYVGEPVAAIIAESRYLAEDASEQAIVDYDELPCVRGVHDALAVKAVLHPASSDTNIAAGYAVARGDAEAALRGAAHRRKGRFNVHRHTGMPLETRGLVARWDAEREKLTIHGAAKYPFRTRECLALMLGFSPSSIDYIEVDVGGSFGVRGHLYPEDFLVAVAALRTGRPVKFIEDRREHMMATHHSREGECELEIGLDADFRIVALKADVLTDLGAYAACGGGAVVPSKTLQFIPGPYRIPNYSAELKVLLTNKTPIGTFRGPGRYEAVFYMERLLDIVAHEHDIDPVELRRRNLLTPQELPYDGGLLVPSMGRSAYDTGDYHMTLERVLKETDYSRLAEMAGREIEGRLHGVGVACYVDSTGVGPSETASITLRAGEPIEVRVGSSSSGQGIETVMAQVAAERLCVPFESIVVRHGSTDLLSHGVGFSHSRCAVMGGNAVDQCARVLLERLIERYAATVGCVPTAIVYRQGSLVDAQSGALLATLQQALTQIGGHLTVEETFRNSTLTYTYGAQVAHVAVDPLTAEIEVLRFMTVEDIGRCLNPMVVHGQAIGASFQGISGTLLDQFIYDERGQLLNASWADYLVGTATDFPNVEAITLEEYRSASNPMGLKGGGEGAISGTGAALSNAVSSALRSLNVEVTQLPISPSVLYELMQATHRQETQSSAIEVMSQ